MSVPKISSKTNKTIKLAEISLKDFTDKARNELLNWFSINPGHWIMLHMVMIAYLKSQTITKNQLIKFVQKSYLTSNSYIDAAVKKNYFKTIKNTNDKRSIFILPTEQTVEVFAKYVDKRAWLYKDVK
jgi:DNA-binding MarR family transcriptional regulator|tara:strand:+ start:1022 stop:1405 length:384 start_codon:yes stop_codon:yes gene_type:complete